MEENEKVEIAPEEGYVPRPAWQVWAARVGLVVFILLVLLQIWRMANGVL